MQDAFGKEIKLGARVRYGTIANPKEGRVMKIVQRLVSHPVKNAVTGLWGREERTRTHITIGIPGKFCPVLIGVKAKNVMVVDGPRPAN